MELRLFERDMEAAPPRRLHRYLYAIALLFGASFVWVNTASRNMWENMSSRAIVLVPEEQSGESGLSPSASRTTTTRPNIAIVSGFVSDYNNPDARLEEKYYAHMINKACYADLWGYDLIFNSTPGFPNADYNASQYWLKWGTWHRVPHIMAALPNYDWIVYTDTDWTVQDLMHPIDSFIKDWELHGHDVHVLLPIDFPDAFTFSAFVVMIRNSPFGRRLVHNWYNFSQGLCPKGNFPTNPNVYGWEDSDQPGLWYALAQTHYEMYHPEKVSYELKCTEDGYIYTDGEVLNPELNNYFRALDAKHGVHGNEMRRNKVPPEQPIRWSITDNATKAGLGVQKDWGLYPETYLPDAFAIHRKREFEGKMKDELDMCRTKLGCYAHYDSAGQFQLGCNRTKAIV